MIGVARLYAQTAVLAGRRAASAWPVAFSLVLYAILVMLAARVVAPLGRIGGFVLGMVLAACFSSYVHLISQVVSGSRVRFADLRQSFGARFWDVVSVLFAFWIINLPSSSTRARRARSSCSSSRGASSRSTVSSGCCPTCWRRSR